MAKNRKKETAEEVALRMKEETEVAPEVTPEPEVVPEVTPEPEVAPEVTPEVEPEVEVVTESKHINVDEVKKLIADNKVSALETLKEVANNGIPQLKTIASVLLDYETDLGTGIKDGNFVVSKNYNLYLMLRSVTETSDKVLFRTKFDIINLAFKEFSKSTFNEVKLHAHDYIWSYGDKQLTTYQKLVSTINLLCDKTKHQDNLRKVDIKTVMDGTDLTDISKTNLVSYYNI